jgi:hypothetical protein
MTEFIEVKMTEFMEVKMTEFMEDHLCGGRDRGSDGCR